MSLTGQRRVSPGLYSAGRSIHLELNETLIKNLYTVLMGALLLEFLCRMAFYALADETPRLVTAGQVLTAGLGIWLGKTWKDKGFRMMACYILWMALRCFVSAREETDVFPALERIATLVWAAGGCYSLGRILTRKETGRFLGVMCLAWTAGMAVSACLGIAAAWMRIRIYNLSGTATWRMWGEAEAARLNLVYCATISGGILSVSILMALLAGFQTRQPAMKACFFAAVLPMTLALCLTDSRTAQISLAAGVAALFFVLSYSRIRSAGALKSGMITGNGAVRPKQLLILFAGMVLAGALTLWILMKINPVFDSIKIACTRAGILPSAAISEDGTVLMAHRGFSVEDVLTGRGQIWKAVLAFFRDHPRYLLYGSSIVNSMARVLDQNVLSFEAGHCHNIALQILAEGGLPALLLAVGFVWHIGKKSAVRIFSGKNTPVWLVLIPCVILSMIVGDMGECFTWMGFRSSPIPFILFLLAGITAAPDGKKAAEEPRASLRSCLAFPMVCAVIMGCTLPVILHHTVPVIRQDEYDNPESDLFYECGEEGCETHYGKHTIKTSGCGLCAISNAVRYMTGSAPDVRGLATFARNNEQYIVHVGSKSTVSEEAAKAFGEAFGFCYIGQVAGLAEAVPYVKQGCTVIAGVGNDKGGGHLLVIADYDPLTKKYLILDSAGNYESWSHSFCSWQRINDNRLQNNPNVYLTSFRILGPSRLAELRLPDPPAEQPAAQAGNAETEENGTPETAQGEAPGRDGRS